MLLYHDNANAPVDCHPTQIDYMKSIGWQEELPPDTVAAKPKPETKPAV